METRCNLIQFRIDIDFKGCDVDMVFKEMASRGVTTPVPSILCDGAKIPIDKNKLPKTPTEASVDFCLEWLHGYVDRNEMKIQNGKWDTDHSKPMITATTEDGFEYSTWPSVQTELEELGVKVVSTYGLMMGTCHLICEVGLDEFSNQLVKDCKKVVFDVFKKLVQYYEPELIG